MDPRQGPPFFVVNERNPAKKNRRSHRARVGSDGVVPRAGNLPSGEERSGAEASD